MESSHRSPQKCKPPNNIAPVCCLKHCGKQKTPTQHLSTFGFPKDAELLLKWSENLKLPLDQCVGRVCIEHFELQVVGARKLRPGAVPTLQLGYEGKPKHTNQMNEIRKDFSRTPEIQRRPVADEEGEANTEQQIIETSESTPNANTNSHYAEKLTHSVFRLCCLKHCRKRNKRERESGFDENNSAEMDSIISDIQTFKFPEEPELLQKWLDNLQLTDIKKLSATSHLCALHFEPKAIFNGKLKLGAVPTLELGDNIQPVHLNSEDILNNMTEKEIFDYCHIENCKNSGKGSTTHLYKFPKSQEMQQIWCENLKLNDEDVSSYRICYLHFETRCLNHMKLYKWAVPTLELGHSKTVKHHNPPAVSENNFISTQRCCLQSCRKTRHQNGVELFPFPNATHLLARKWCHNTKMAIHQISQLRICSEHFVKSAMVNGRTRSWALPTLNLGHSDNIYENPTQHLEHCCVEHCESTELNGLFGYPKRSCMLRKWAVNTGQDPYLVHKLNLKICRKHFSGICFNEHNELKPDALPTLHLNGSSVHQLDLEEDENDKANVACSVCRRSIQTDGVKLFQFPKDATLLAKWEHNLQLKLTNASDMLICDLHFEPLAFSKYRLHDQAIPTRLLGHNKSDLNLYTMDYTLNSTYKCASAAALVNCCVKGCNKTRQFDGVHLYRFPKQRSMATKWEYNLQLKLTTKQLNYFKVCEIHFEPACRGSLHLEPGAIPTLHLGHNDKNIYRFDVNPSDKEQIMPPINATTVASHKVFKNVPCAVNACPAANQLQLKFWPLPENADLKKHWCAMLNLDTTNITDRTQLCAMHYVRAYELSAKDSVYKTSLEALYEVYELLVKSSRLQLFCCSVPGCNLTIIDDVKLFKLPSNAQMLQKWLHNTQIEYDEKRSYIYRVCTSHFEKHLLQGSRIPKCAVPTLKLPDNDNIYENELADAAEMELDEHTENTNRTTPDPETEKALNANTELNLMELELSNASMQSDNDVTQQHPNINTSKTKDAIDSHIDNALLDTDHFNNSVDKATELAIVERLNTNLQSRVDYHENRNTDVHINSNLGNSHLVNLNIEIASSESEQLTDSMDQSAELAIVNRQNTNLGSCVEFHENGNTNAHINSNSGNSPLANSSFLKRNNVSIKKSKGKCAVRTCIANNALKLKLLPLPADVKLCKVWCDLLALSVTENEVMEGIAFGKQVCALHFMRCYEMSLNKYADMLLHLELNDTYEMLCKSIRIQLFRCSVPGCEASIVDSLQLHPLPDNVELLNKWLQSTHINYVEKRHNIYRICSRHFDITLKTNTEDLVPTCNLPTREDVSEEYFSEDIPEDEELNQHSEANNQLMEQEESGSMCSTPTFSPALKRRVIQHVITPTSTPEPLLVTSVKHCKNQKCAVPNCTYATMLQLRTWSLPNNRDLRTNWCKLLNLDETNVSSIQICALHFMRAYRISLEDERLKAAVEELVEIYDALKRSTRLQMFSCSVPGCCTSIIDGIRQLKIPNNSEIAQKWLHNTGITTYDVKRRYMFRVCATHFEPYCFTNARLHKWAMPTLNLPTNKNIFENEVNPGDIKLTFEPMKIAQKQHKVAPVKSNKYSIYTASNIANEGSIASPPITLKLKCCCVPNCGRSKLQDGVKLYKFPNSPEVIEKWCHNFKLDVKTALTGFVCSVHFDENCFRSGRLLLRVIPTLHLGHTDTNIYNAFSDEASLFECQKASTSRYQMNRHCDYPKCRYENTFLLKVPNATDMFMLLQKSKEEMIASGIVIEELCTKHFKIYYKQCKSVGHMYPHDDVSFEKLFGEYTNKVVTGFCAVRDCYTNIYTDSKKVEFFAFPSDPQLREKWSFSLNIAMNSEVESLYTICSLHFDASAFDPYTTRLQNGAVPTLNLPTECDEQYLNEDMEQNFIENKPQFPLEEFHATDVQDNAEYRSRPEDEESQVPFTEIKIKQEIFDEPDENSQQYVIADCEYNNTVFNRDNFDYGYLETEKDLNNDAHEILPEMKIKQEVIENDEIVEHISQVQTVEPPRFEITQVTSQSLLANKKLYHSDIYTERNVNNASHSSVYHNQYFKRIKTEPIDSEADSVQYNDADDDTLITPQRTQSPTVSYEPHNGHTPTLDVQLEIDRVEEYNENNAYNELLSTFCDEENEEYDNPESNIDFELINQRRCQILGCPSRKETPDIILHKFPAPETMLKKWEHNTQVRVDRNHHWRYRICSRHFEHSSYSGARLLLGTMPTLNLGPNRPAQIYQNEYSKNALPIVTPIITTLPAQMRSLTKVTIKPNDLAVSSRNKETISALPPLRPLSANKSVPELLVANANRSSTPTPGTDSSENKNLKDFFTKPQYAVFNKSFNSRRCRIEGCNSHAEMPGITLHKFPLPEDHFRKWVHNTGIQVDPACRWRYRICNLHFEPGCLRGVRFLPGTMPTLNLGPNRPARIYENDFAIGSIANNTAQAYPMLSKFKKEPFEQKFCLVSGNKPSKPKPLLKLDKHANDWHSNQNHCSVPGCTTVSEDDFVKLYEFPYKKRMFKKWLHNTQINVNDSNRGKYRICSLHFEDECFGEGLELHYGSVPTLNLGRYAARWKHVNDFDEDPNITDTEPEESEDEQQSMQISSSQSSTRENNIVEKKSNTSVSAATKCCIDDCTTSVDTSLMQLHVFPKSIAICQKWMHNIQIQLELDKVEGYAVCSRHFAASCYKGNELLPDAVPTLNLGTKTPKTLFLNTAPIKVEGGIESWIERTNSTNQSDDSEFMLNARCSIPTCHRERGVDGVSLHRLPQYEPLQRKWLKNCRLDLKSLNNLYHRPRICSKHFEKRCFVGIKQPILQYGSIPTQNLGYDFKHTEDNDANVDDNVDEPSKDTKNKSQVPPKVDTTETPNGLVEYEVTKSGEIITYNAIKSGYQKCSLIHCQKNLTIHGVKTYKFPKSAQQCEKWTHNLNIKYDRLRPWKYLICSDHFEKCCFITTDTKTSLTRWAVPTLKLGNNIPKVLFRNAPWLSSSKQQHADEIDPLKNAGDSYDDDSIDDDQLLFAPTTFKRKRNEADGVDDDSNNTDHLMGDESKDYDRQMCHEKTKKPKQSMLNDFNKITFRQKHCCLPHCRAERGPDVKLFRVPSDSELLEKWEHNLNMKFLPNERNSNRVCQRHFESCLIGVLRLLKGSIPTLNLGDNAPLNLYTNDHVATAEMSEDENDEVDRNRNEQISCDFNGDVNVNDETEMIECSVEIDEDESYNFESDFDNQTLELSNDNASDSWSSSNYAEQDGKRQRYAEPRKQMYKQSHCCLPYCRQARGGNIKLFRIPRYPALLAKWEHNLRYKFNIAERNISLVCSTHFEPHVIGVMRLMRGAIPTLNLGHNSGNIYKPNELDYLRVRNNNADYEEQKKIALSKFNSQPKHISQSTSILQKVLNRPANSGSTVKNPIFLEPICCLPYCSRRGSRDGVRFFKFPQGELYSTWCQILGIDEDKYRNSELNICSAHFAPNCYAGGNLKPFAKPTLCLSTTGNSQNQILKCIAKNCRTTHLDGNTLYTFPENRNLCAKWCHNLKIEQTNNKLNTGMVYRLCAKHFENNCLRNDKLHPEAVPTRNLGHDDTNIFSNTGSFATLASGEIKVIDTIVKESFTKSSQQFEWQPSLGNYDKKTQLNKFYADYKMARRMLPTSTVLSIANSGCTENVSERDPIRSNDNADKNNDDHVFSESNIEYTDNNAINENDDDKLLSFD